MKIYGREYIFKRANGKMKIRLDGELVGVHDKAIEFMNGELECRIGILCLVMIELVEKFYRS